jgi:hypothetical protein
MPEDLRAAGLIYDVATGHIDTVIAPSPLSEGDVQFPALKHSAK